MTGSAPPPTRTASTPAKSSTRHWCAGGSYEGAVYAVPHAPPCESSYPCASEPHEKPCAGLEPGCVHGVVAMPHEYAYPDSLTQPRATGTETVARFSVKLPRSDQVTWPELQTVHYLDGYRIEIIEQG